MENQRHKQKYTLKLEPGTVNQVLAALQELPYKVSAAPIGVIMQQVQEQDAVSNAEPRPIKE